MKQRYFPPILFSIIILATLPILARAERNLSVNDIMGYATVSGLPPRTGGGLPFREEEAGIYSKGWQFSFAEEDKRQAIRLIPDTLKPNALVLRQVEREDIEEHFVVDDNGSTLTRFIINREQAPSRLGKVDSHSPSIEGSLFSGKVLDVASVQVALSTVYLEEQAILDRDLDRGITRDHAWSLGADTQLLSGQVQLYGEYAWSRHGSKLAAAMPARDDGAYKLQLSYGPGNTTFGDFPLDWVMGIKHQGVGPFFQSPATPNGRRDVSLVEAFTHLNWRELTLDGLVAQEKSNFASPYLQSPQQIQHAQLRGGYRFPDLGLPLWLGRPSINLLVSKRNREAFDQGTSNAKLEVGFSHQGWIWRLSQTLSWYASEANKSVYGRPRTTTVETRFKLFGNRLSLAPRFQYRHAAAQPSTEEQWQVGVDTWAVLIPERVKGQLRADVKRVGKGGGMQHTYSTIGNLNWQFARWKARIPMLRLFLEGRYEAILNQMHSAAFIKDYRLFLGVAFN